MKDSNSADLELEKSFEDQRQPEDTELVRSDDLISYSLECDLYVGLPSYFLRRMGASMTPILKSSPKHPAAWKATIQAAYPHPISL